LSSSGGGEYYVVVWGEAQGEWLIEHEWWITDKHITKHARLD